MIPTDTKEEARRIHDCIRGSLMAGAMGDALGYTVEFMSRNSILSIKWIKSKKKGPFYQVSKK